MRLLVLGLLIALVVSCGGDDGPMEPSIGPPVRVAFMVQPSSARAGAPVNPAVHVMLQDAQGNVVSDSMATITVAITGGTGTAGAVLGGTLTQTTVKGVAMFASLTVDAAGNGYALSAVAANLMGATSSTFGISPLEDAPVYVRLESDAGDYIGAGRNYGYASASAVVSATATGNHLRVTVAGRESWTGEFREPSALTRLEPGAYTGLQRFPYHDPAVGGLSWSGEARGCNTLDGSFTIDSVTYDGDSLTAVDLRFEQHCDRDVPALRGTIHWRPGDTTAIPGPVHPVPVGLWRPAAGSTPATGNYVYLMSDAGDFIGQGDTLTYTPGNSTITITAPAPDLSIRVRGQGSDEWGGGLRPMLGLSAVQPGFYSDLWRFGFHNPVKGGFGWGGNARGCNASLSWVAVDRIVYAGGQVTGLDLRFEQRCELDTPALRGAIHWNN